MARKTSKPIDILRRLQKAKNDPAKQKIIRDAWMDNRDDFFVGIQLSFDPKVRFGLEKVPSIEEGEDVEVTFGYHEFMSLVEDLRHEEDLDTKRKMVRDAALQADIDEWNHWYRPILLKTLHTNLPMNIIVSTLGELTKR